MWLFLLFLIVPLVEIALFIQIGGAIGLWPTLAIVVLTALLGTVLVRAQGALALGRLRASFEDLQDPTEPLAHGAMILFSGALLLTPGFFTDAVGFLLLMPPVREWAYHTLRRRVEVRRFGTPPPHRPGDPRRPGDAHRHPGPRRGDGPVIEPEWEEVEPPRRSAHRGSSGWTRH